jgi:hypothetical protein
LPCCSVQANRDLRGRGAARGGERYYLGRLAADSVVSARTGDSKEGHERNAQLTADAQQRICAPADGVSVLHAHYWRYRAGGRQVRAAHAGDAEVPDERARRAGWWRHDDIIAS